MRKFNYNMTVSHDNKGVTQRCYHDFDGTEHFYLNYYIGEKLIMNSGSYNTPLSESELYVKLEKFLKEITEGVYDDEC